MPRGNGTGPHGHGNGRGFGRGQGGGGRHRHGNDFQSGGRGLNNGGGYGPDGYCVCAKCGEKVPHEAGVKCTTIKCPKCGHSMAREELLDNKREKND